MPWRNIHPDSDGSFDTNDRLMMIWLPVQISEVVAPFETSTGGMASKTLLLKA